MKKTISAVLVSMAIVSSLSAQAAPNLEVDNTFTYAGAPMCIPVNTTVDYGQVEAEDVMAIARSTPDAAYGPLAGPVNFNIQLLNCAKDQSVNIKGEGIVDVTTQGDILGVTKGMGKSEVFAVAHILNRNDAAAVTSANEQITSATPTVTYKLEEADKIPMTGYLYMRGFAGPDGLVNGAESTINAISNGSHTIKSKYTITMN